MINPQSLSDWSQPSEPSPGRPSSPNPTILAQAILNPATPDQTMFHLDWSYLHTLSDLDHDFELTLLEVFVDDCRLKIMELKAAIDQSNLHQIEHLAHYLKGASANVGAQQMQHYAHRIETQVRDTQLTCFDVEMNRLETSFSIIQELLASEQE